MSYRAAHAIRPLRPAHSDGAFDVIHGRKLRSLVRRHAIERRQVAFHAGRVGVLALIVLLRDPLLHHGLPFRLPLRQSLPPLIVTLLAFQNVAPIGRRATAYRRQRIKNAAHDVVGRAALLWRHSRQAVRLREGWLIARHYALLLWGWEERGKSRRLLLFLLGKGISAIADTGRDIRRRGGNGGCRAVPLPTLASILYCGGG